MDQRRPTWFDEKLAPHVEQSARTLEVQTWRRSGVTSVSSSAESNGAPEVAVREMFRRSDRQWIIAGVVVQGSLAVGQRVVMTAGDLPPVNATVRGFNVCTSAGPEIDLLIETESVIERELPARIYQRPEAE